MNGRPAVWDDAATLSATELGERLDRLDASHLVWVEPGSRLIEGAEDRIAEALRRHPVDLLYGDALEQVGGVAAEVRRPQPSPLRLREQDHLGGARVFSVDAIRRVGGFDEAARGRHGHDLALRILGPGHEAAAVCLPGVLSRRDATGPVTALTPELMTRRLADVGADAEVAEADHGLAVRYRVRGEPLVSIVIPTRGSSAVVRGRTSVLVVDAVRGILERSTYPRLEVVVVADAVTPEPVVRELRELAGDRLRLVPWDAPFDFAAKLNRGVVHATGEAVVLLNDDVDLVDADWIEQLLGLCQQPGVGMAGTLLHFEDGTVQHGGHVYRDGEPTHIAFGWDAGRDDPLRSMSVVREVSGVTAAAAMLPREAYLAVGGLSREFPNNYNDVDLSLKLRAAGRSVVWTPRARLVHFESKTRDPRVRPEELARLRARWGRRIEVDGYWPSR